MNEIPAWDVPLARLVDEGFAATVGGLVDNLAARGVAVGVDGSGRLAITEAAAGLLRDERAERERAEAERRAEAARLAERRQAGRRAELAAKQRTDRRIRRLEAQLGPMWTIHELMTREAVQAAGGMSVRAREAMDDHVPTLDEVERWAAETRGIPLPQDVGLA